MFFEVTLSTGRGFVVDFGRRVSEPAFSIVMPPNSAIPPPGITGS